MKGTLVNALAVILGSGIGIILKQGLPTKYQQTIMHGLGLAIAVIGIQMALKTQNMLIVIISLVLGGIIGEAIDIDKILTTLGDNLSAKFGREHGMVGEGFITASLVFCIGAMAVVGSIQEGLNGDASTLYAKSMLDGVSSIIFTASMGIGVMFSSIPIFLYQGSITILAGYFSSVLSEFMLTEITAVGGVLIIGISLIMLEIKKIKIANLLPSIPLAAVIAMLWTK